MQLPVDFPGAKITCLGIRCSNGYKLKWIEENIGYQCRALEPSGKAVEIAKQKGIDVIRATADNLPFPNSTFNIVIFGFCLYLCDREDLFRIAFEADRVLKNPCWLIIHDFYSPSHTKNPYHHAPGLFSYKMDYKTMFTWHPAYTCFKNVIFHHENFNFTDDLQEWTQVAVLRKKYIL